MTIKAPHKNYKWELLALLCCAYFFHQGDRAIFGVVLTKIQTELNLTSRELGFVQFALFSTLAIMMPVAGCLGDVWNKKRIIIGSLIFWSAATMFTGLAGGMMALIAFRGVATAGGESFYAPAAYPLMAAYHTRTRALALSLHQAALYISVMLSGFLGGTIAEHWGWRSAFFVYGGAGIGLGLVFVWRLRDAPAPASATAAGAGPVAKDSVWQSLTVVFRSPTAILFTMGLMAIVFVNNAYLSWAPKFLEKRFDLPAKEAGSYAMFYHHLAALAGILVGGWISDRMAIRQPAFRPKMMCGAMLLGAPIIFLMGSWRQLELVCAAMAGFGLFRGFYEANTHAALFEVIEPRHRASVIGVTVMLAFLTGSLSPLILGHLDQIFPGGQGLGYGFCGLSSAYALGGLAVLTAAIFTFSRDRCREESA